MVTYDDLVNYLEDAWIVYDLHEHTLIENVIPETHDRTYRAELFPDHPEPLHEENMPPWVDLNFTWSASHQLRSEGRDIASEPLYLSWTYTVFVRETMYQYTDQKLVRLFQKSLQAALRRFLTDDTPDTLQVSVEVRRIYQSEGDQFKQAYIQLVSTNITDLSEQWSEHDLVALQQMVRMEVQLVSAVLHSLSETFHAGGHGNYHTARTA